MTKPYHHGDLRNALIQAGQAILAAEGVAGLDLRKVARAAGVSHAAPYRHFADKQALLAAIAAQGFEQLAERMASALAAAPDDSRAQLTQLAHAYVGFAFEHPAHMREMFSGLTLDRSAHPALHTAAKVAFHHLLAVIERGQARQAIGPGDPASLATVVWAQLHGVTMLLIEDQIMGVKGDGQAVDHLVAQCVGTLYDGLRAGIGG
jgi:AcrR family transcriptional regulator